MALSRSCETVRVHRHENAEAAAAAVPGADVRFVPLRRPTADWRMTEVALGQCWLLCGRMGTDTSSFATLDRNLLYFLAPLSGSGWTSYGKEIGTLAVLAHTTEHAAWIGHAVHSTSLQVPVEVFERAYSRFSGGEPTSWRSTRMFKLDDDTAGRVKGVITTILRTARQRPRAFADPSVGRRLEALILERLLQAVCSESRAERPEYRALSRKCNDYLAEHADGCVTALDLRDALGIGDRALRRFFRSTYGVSPAKFLRLKRLHGVNRSLGEGAVATSVTHAALSFGFFDLGRFAGDYLRLFGERPSETLRRTRNGTSAKSPVLRSAYGSRA